MSRIIFYRNRNFNSTSIRIIYTSWRAVFLTIYSRGSVNTVHGDIFSDKGQFETIMVLYFFFLFFSFYYRPEILRLRTRDKF